MADIHLLFDVFGGESIHEGSGREINRQLTEIVRQINANPFKINFEADEEALNRIKKAFSDLHKSIGENGTIKFDTPNLSDISKTLSAISENFRHVLTGIGSQNLQLKQIFEAIPDGGDSSVKSLTRVIERIEELTRVIDGLGAAVDEINTKTGAVNLNVIGNGAIQESQEQLHAYREYLNVVMREFAKVQAAYNGLMDQSRSGVDVRKAYDTSAVIDSNKQLSALMRSFDLESAINNSSVMDLDQLKSAIQTYTSMLGIMSGIQSKGQRIFGDIDNAGITAARQEAERAAESINKMDDAPSEDTGGGGLSEYVAKIRSDIETLRDPCKEIKGEIDRIFTFDGIDVTGSEELVGKVKSVCEQLGEEFDNLRAKVANTFNFSGVEIIPPDVTKTVSELANVGKDIPVGGVTGLTRNEIEGIIKSKLGSEGGALAESSLKSFGVSAEDAKRIAEDLLEMGGNIKDVTTQFKDLADGTRNSFNITATATDELGNTIKEKLTYRLQEVENEAGETVKALQLVQREQIEKISYGKEIDNTQKKADDYVAAEERKRQADQMTADQAKNNLLELIDLRRKYEDAIKRAENAGVNSDSLDAMRTAYGEVAKLESEVQSVANAENAATLGMTEYKQSVDEAKQSLRTLGGEVKDQIKTAESLSPMNDNQIAANLIKIRDTQREVQELLNSASETGTVNTAETRSLEDLISRLDILRTRLEQNKITSREFADEMRVVNGVLGKSGTPLRENAQEADALAKKMSESAMSVRGAWAEASDQNKASLLRLRQELENSKTAYDSEAITAQSYGGIINRLSEEYDRLSSAVKREYDEQKRASAETKSKNSEANTRLALQRKLSDESGRAAKILQTYTAAEKSKNAASRDAYQRIKELIPEMDDLNARIKSGEVTTEEATRKQRDYSAALSEAAATVEKDGDAHLTAFGKIAKAVKTHLTTLSATAIIGTVMREARELITTVTEIDTAMTELRKVTDETEARYATFLDNAATRAKNLSATISDTVTATADFARLGLTIDEAEAAADAAIVYKAVGDGIENISDASQSIVSTMKAFGIEASDAMSIVDKFNEVGKRIA